MTFLLDLRMEWSLLPYWTLTPDVEGKGFQLPQVEFRFLRVLGLWAEKKESQLQAL